MWKPLNFLCLSIYLYLKFKHNYVHGFSVQLSTILEVNNQIMSDNYEYISSKGIWCSRLLVSAGLPNPETVGWSGMLHRKLSRFLQALLVEQGLTVSWFSICVCICVCICVSETISRPLIGRNSETSRDVGNIGDVSDFSTSSTLTSLMTWLRRP